MRLVVDTSVLVGELLRTKGRERLADERLDLFLPERMWGEVQIEPPRRIAAFARRRGLTHATRDELTALSLEAVRTNMVVTEVAVYSDLEEEARARSRRDPDDWPVVACALALTAGVWTTTTTSSAPASLPGPPTRCRTGSTAIRPPAGKAGG